MHSLVSDGSHHPRDLVKVAIKKGLNAISITDHDTFLGSILGKSYSKINFIVLPGSEVRTEIGDILVLCEHPVKICKNVTEMIDIAKDNNCVLIPPHPYDALRLGIGSLVRLRYWDAIECFNGASDPLSNLISYISSTHTGKPLVANSDAHIPDNIGMSFNIIEVNELTVEEILESIRRGNIVPYPRYTVTGLFRRISWPIKRTILKLLR
jgi:hypothetical protein